MKRFSPILFALFLLGCSKNDRQDNCNFLLNVGVNFTVNLNLPQYSQLEFSGNTEYIANQGNAGIYVSRLGNELRAFDAADPNHAPTSCSILQNDNGIGTCGCEDGNTFSLLTGQVIGTALPCGLREYRVDALGGNEFLISN